MIAILSQHDLARYHIIGHGSNLFSTGPFIGDTKFFIAYPDFHEWEVKQGPDWLRFQSVDLYPNPKRTYTYRYNKVSFVLFNDTWSRVRIFRVRCNHTLSLLANHQVIVTRPCIKWIVILMIADGHLIFLRGLYEYMWVNNSTYSLFNPRGSQI